MLHNFRSNFCDFLPSLMGHLAEINLVNSDCCKHCVYQETPKIWAMAHLTFHQSSTVSQGLCLITKSKGQESQTLAAMPHRGKDTHRTDFSTKGRTLYYLCAQGPTGSQSKVVLTNSAWKTWAKRRDHLESNLQDEEKFTRQREK